MQQQRPGLPLQVLSNNLRAMSRWCPVLSAMLLATAAFACNDELTQEVPEDVCVSLGPSGSVRPGIQWVGGKRGSEEMYPGRDCVGCHLENDGPEFMFGGTVYPYEERGDYVGRMLTPPSGDDCFGLEGVTVKIIGEDEQEFVTTTNRAGNFFVEGKPTDLKKPYRVELTYKVDYQEAALAPTMGTRPNYGGCGRCHSSDAQPYPVGAEMPDGFSEDERVTPARTKVGIGGAFAFTRQR